MDSLSVRLPGRKNLAESRLIISKLLQEDVEDNPVGLLVERFVSPFQVKLLVAGKVEAHRAAVQMVWDAG